jgi:hypothetical protein
MRLRAHEKRILQDILLIAISVLIAVWIERSELLHSMVSRVRELEYLASFIAGFFFTSVFTIAPSIVVLGELAQENSAFIVIFFGGLGAMCGDYILFRFVKDRVTKDLAFLMQSPKAKRFGAFFQTHLPRILWPLIGSLIIVSPLPDEIGIAMLGLSRIDTIRFLPLSLFLNMVGIALVALIAKTVA